MIKLQRFLNVEDFIGHSRNQKENLQQYDSVAWQENGVAQP